MGGFCSYKPVFAMVFLQCIVAGFALFSKAALSKGISPTVFVVYRQAVATLMTAPPSCFSRWYIILIAIFCGNILKNLAMNWNFFYNHFQYKTLDYQFIN